MTRHALLPDQAHSDALAVLADVAGNARDEMEVAGRLQVGIFRLLWVQNAPGLGPRDSAHVL